MAVRRLTSWRGRSVRRLGEFPNFVLKAPIGRAELARRWAGVKAVLYAVQDVVLLLANVVRDNSSICAIAAGFLAFVYLVGR